MSSEKADQIARVVEARKRGWLDVATQFLNPMLSSDPANPRLHHELALIRLDFGDFSGAEKALAEAVKLAPAQEEIWVSLCMLYARTGNKANEIKSLRRALSLTTKPKEPLLNRLLALHVQSNDYQNALQVVKHLRTLPNAPAYLAFEESKILVLCNKKGEALEILDGLVGTPPCADGVIEFWARLLIELKTPERAKSTFEKLLKQGRGEPALLHALGRACMHMDQGGEAEKHLEKSLKIDPKNALGWYELGLLRRQRGDIANSQIAMQKSLDVDPSNAMVMRVHGAEHKFSYGDEHMQRLHLAWSKLDSYNPQQKAELFYALGKAHEDVGEVASAFELYKSGGALRNIQVPYRHGGAVSTMRQMAAKITPPSFKGYQDDGFPSDKPVFVLGMPRSGTSLIEQVIASHPKAYGAGELKLLHRVIDMMDVNGFKCVTSGIEDATGAQTHIPGVDLNCRELDRKTRGERYVQAIEKLAGKSCLRIVDKMPGNHFWTGLIPFILPKAKIIHTRRHPVDTCLSCYRIFFPDGMPWSYDLRNLGLAYRAYHEHMMHWEKVLPEGVMISVRYEEVVADLETQAKRIISHIGLEWNDACLKFYETDRPVKTASLSQVRKPIYTSSIGKWRKYEPYLGPLMKELGPLVKEYEEELEAALSDA